MQTKAAAYFVKPKKRRQKHLHGEVVAQPNTIDNILTARSATIIVLTRK